MKQKVVSIFCILQVFAVHVFYAQSNLITNIPNRQTISLNGKWQYIIDPYETGFYDYRYTERPAKDKDAYWNSDVPSGKADKIEHGYNDKYTLKVPGDWNSQEPKFLYYEGTVWYKKSFDYSKKPDGKIFLHFGAVNYKADVYLNGTKLGSHKGGFTAFNFEVSTTLLKEKNNWLVVKVDNKRSKDEVPTLNTDWWNYGGITRDVNLVLLPGNYIQDYSIQLSKAAYNTTNKTIEGWVKTNTAANDLITIEIPALKVEEQFVANGDSTAFKINVPGIKLWSPKNPTLYKVIISSKNDRTEDKIGFRNVEVNGEQVLLNGKRIFFRGISIHEEIPGGIRRATNYSDAVYLLGQAKELNANMVRLAHYPHNENMTRVADSLGLLVWSEIPVYWTIDFGSAEVLAKAKMQLNEMITRDRN